MIVVDNEKFKVLIVDDEKANLDVLDHILKPLYTVLIAKNGNKALSMAQQHSPDLILLDVIMPDISGFETLAKLKKSDSTRNIPVIFITGLNNIEDEEKGFFLGAVDYIKKPFHPSIVKARVRTQLQIVHQMRTIERIGMIDALTNIPNRRNFDNHLSVEWKRAIREKTPISILIIDIDNFKMYNDTYGHPHGDFLLKSVSKSFVNTVKRATDFIARWGGEEFVVLLSNTHFHGAFEIAERIRANIEKMVIPFTSEMDTYVTVSIGLNSINPNTNDLISDFISNADKALYKAKTTGKNKVCSFQDELQS